MEALLEAVAREGDAVLTLGAGNVWQAGGQLLARAARQRLKAKHGRANQRSGIRWRLWLNVALACAALAVVIYRRGGARCAVRAPRPAVHAVPPDDRDAGLSMDGLRLRLALAGAARLRGRFRAQHFPAPLEERRRRLLAIDWVEDASVSRIWPNRLVVRIHERKPVAFVNLPVAEGGARGCC